MAGPRERQVVNASETFDSFRQKFNKTSEDVGATKRLTTTEDSDIVGAINEHDAELGTITSGAMGTTASTVSTAIAELDGRLDSINDTLLNTPKLWVRDSAATNYIHGDVQLYSDLDVRENVQVEGNLVVDGNVDLGNTTSDTISMTGRVDTDIVPSTDNARDLGSSSLEFRNLYVDGIGYIDSVQADNINVVSDVTLGGDLNVGDSARVDGSFSVGSAVNIGTDLRIGNDIYVVDSAYIGGDATIGATLYVASDTTIGGNVQVDGTLTVDGVVSFKAGSAGTIDLGDANTDNVVFNADVNSHIIPNTDNTYDLGSASQEWRHAYIDGTVNADNVAADSATVSNNLSVGGTLSANGDVDLGNATSDTISMTGRVDTDIVPSTDNARDLGSASLQFRNLYVDGVGNIDDVVADTATVGSLKVSDLTDNRVLIAGASGELEDNTNFTFDGTTLTVGSTTIRRDTVGINTTALEADNATVTGDLDVQGVTTLDETTVDGTLTTTGTATFNSNVLIENDLRIEDSATITGNLRVVGNITSDSRAFYIQADSAGTDQVNFGETIRIRGSEGIDVTRDGSNGWFIDAEVATSSNLGIATFNTGDFDVTAGDVTIKSAGVGNSQLENSSITFGDADGNTAVSLGGAVTLQGQANEVDVTRSGSTFTIQLPDDVGITNNLTVGNDFTISGDFILAGVQRLAGQYIFLLDGATGSPILDAGLDIERGDANNAQLIWDEGNDYWKASYDNSASTLSQIITAANIDNNTLEFTSGTVNVKNNGVALGTKTTGNYVATVTGTANEIAVTGSGTETASVTIGLPDDVDIDNSLTTVLLTVSDDATIGDLLTTADLVVTDSAHIGGTLTVGGNFRVAGTTTTVNSETVTIDDNIIVLNNNATGPATENAGIEVERGDDTNVQLLWNEVSNRWTVAGAATGTLAYTSETGNATITLTAGTDLITGGNFTTNQSTNETITFDHADTTRTNTTTTASPAINSSFAVVDSVTTNARGHVTGVNTKTVTLSNTDYDNYVSWTAEDSDGTTYTITSGDTLTIRGDQVGVTTNFVADDVLKISHADTSDLIAGAKGTAGVSSITVDQFGHVTAVGTATYDNYGSWTLSGDNGTSQTIASGNTVDIAGGTYLTTSASNTDKLTVNHDNTTRTNNTSNASPAQGGTFTAVDSITTNSTGHITAVNTKTVTLPDADDYSSWTAEDSDGTSYTITSGDTLTIRGDNYGITTNFVANDVLQVSHTDTSSQASVNNSGNTFIQDVSLDRFGHVTSLTSSGVALPSVGNATITLTAGTALSGGGNFTTNQSSTEEITFNIDYGTALVIKNSAGTTLKTIKGVA